MKYWIFSVWFFVGCAAPDGGLPMDTDRALPPTSADGASSDDGQRLTLSEGAAGMGTAGMGSEIEPMNPDASEPDAQTQDGGTDPISEPEPDASEPEPEPEPELDLDANMPLDAFEPEPDGSSMDADLEPEPDASEPEPDSSEPEPDASSEPDATEPEPDASEPEPDADTEPEPDASEPEPDASEPDPCEGVYCNDGDPCTYDTCDNGQCVHDPFRSVVQGRSCNDGAGTCHDGLCCEGCWDGSACHTGDTASACGVRGLACQSCTDAYECTTDLCVAGQCSYEDNDGEYCDDGNGVCQGTVMCMGCGGQGELCCPGDTCGDSLWCDFGTVRTCEACGGRNEPCCEGSSCNASDLTCVPSDSSPSGNRCEPCGGRNEACCATPVQEDRCEEGTLCGPGGVCTCGLPGYPCCPGFQPCGPGGSCSFGVCQ